MQIVSIEENKKKINKESADTFIQHAIGYIKRIFSRKNSEVKTATLRDEMITGKYSHTVFLS